MTTNPTKLAEAIGLLSTVLSSEIAQTNNPFEVEDDDEMVAVETYDELKGAADDFNEEVNNDLEIIRGEISTCLEWESDDPLTSEWPEKMWDDDNDTDTDTEGDEEVTSEESTAEENTGDDAKIIEQAIEEAQTRIAELESSNEKMKAVLENVAEGVNDLIELSNNFNSEVEAY